MGLINYDEISLLNNQVHKTSS